MRNIYFFLLISILLMGCQTYYPVRPNFAKHINTFPVKEAGEVFISGYKMPKEEYIEMGHFSLPMVSSYGNMMALLPARLAEQGFDGAIVLSNNDNVNDEIRYIGFVYSRNFETLESVIDEINISAIVNDSVNTSATVYINWNGQIDSVSGDLGLYAKARLIQPWFFLEQMDRGWYDASTAFYRSRKYGAGITYIYKSLEVDPTFVLSFSETLERYTIVLDKMASNPVVKRVETRDLKEGIHSVFIDKKLIKQVWERTQKGEEIHFNYTYKSKEDLPAQWVVKPEDLVGL